MPVKHSQKNCDYVIVGFCLGPSAKDQGITWVLVLIVHHLVHFLFKSNLSEKKSPWYGIELGSFRFTAKHLSTEQQIHRYGLKIDFYISPQTLDQYWSTLVYLVI